ncbi:MAG: hypothetical protein HY717_19570 [Planctomycetes bacterium]|nr:hypothetical protein [Planctomycetota bacterium]
MLPPAFWLLGLLWAFHPTLLSGLKEVQTDPGDPRLVNYILEHGWRWLGGAPGHERFWSPPFFYPAENVLAYSENLLGAAPLYWPWRAAGLPPDTSFQMWMLSAATLNYLAAWFLLRRCLRLGTGASCAGAFLFAFASSRTAQLGHPQLLPQWYSVLAAAALARLFDGGDAGKGDAGKGAGGTFKAGWIALFFLGVAGQLYASLYLGWFLLVGLAVAALWAAALPACRAPLLRILKAHGWAIALGAMASGLLLLPLAWPYYGASREVGPRTYHQVTYMLPSLASWIYPGEGSWLYGWLGKLPPFRSFRYPAEHSLGIGPITTLLVLIGFCRFRQRAPVRLLALSAATLFLSVTAFLPGSSLWQFLFPVIPGAGAIRALSRIALLFLLPASLGLALFLESCKGRWALLLASAAAVLEQGHTTSSYDKMAVRAEVAALSRAVDRSCRAFLYTPAADRAKARGAHRYHLDAQWAQLGSGIPTLNGYSGSSPPGYGLEDCRLLGSGDLEGVEKALALWAERRGLRLEEACWIKAIPRAE